LNKFTDIKELLLLDPIHEVDEAGWPLLGLDFLRSTQDELSVPLVPSYTGFPKNFEDKWELNHTWQLPIVVGRKGIRRIWGRLG
jgi:hypothetical protein